MTYSAMSRFKDALRGEPKDRIPIFPMISAWAAVNFSDVPFSKLAMDPKRIVDAQIRAREAMGYDAFFGYAESSPVSEAFGCKVRFTETGSIFDALPLTMTCLEDVDHLAVPDPVSDGRLPVILETVRGLNEYGGGEIPVFGGLAGPLTTTCNILGVEKILRMIYQTPQILEALLDKVTSFHVGYGRALIENGANVLFMPEPSASASMISPVMFRQFVLPRLKTLIGTLDVPCMLHMCGDTSPMLDAMAESGAEIISLDQCMDLSKSREMVSDKVLGGNVDPVNSLLMGSAEQVKTDTMTCLRTGGTSRYILMTGCGVPPQTPVENLETMIRTAKEYGLARI
jgi:MtaA/CmuA family methyltransferase